MIAINKKSSTPVYEQIYESIKNEIANNQRKANEKLPPIRLLAADLVVSNNTIKQAYSQLVAEGYVNNIPGSGYYVEKIDTSFFKKKNNPDTITPLQTNTYEKNNIQIKYNLEYGTINPLEFPVKNWKKAIDLALNYEAGTLFSKYGDRDGYDCLKQDIAEHLFVARGVKCSPDQIVIGPSTYVLITQVLILLKKYKSINTYAIENPGYDTIRETMSLLSNKVYDIPVTNTGISISALSKTDAKVTYVTPSHQFPLGVVMPIGKRQKLLQWAIDNNSYIIEDDYDSELRYSSQPIPSLQSIDQNERVIYLGTLSKAISPALRIGYLVLPKHLCNEFNELFNTFNTNIPELEQHALHYFFESGDLEKHLRKTGKLYKQKHDSLIKELKELLPKDFEIIGTGGGTHFILKNLNGRLTEENMTMLALKQGVKVYPTSRYYFGPQPNNKVMVGFASLSTEDISDVCQRLAVAYK